MKQIHKHIRGCSHLPHDDIILGKCMGLVKKLIVNSEEVTASDEILSEIRTFYSKRFERKLNSSYQDCLDYLCSIKTNSLSNPDAETCDGLIKVMKSKGLLQQWPTIKPLEMTV